MIQASMAVRSKGSHFGTAGEYYAMSELLLRGWNVAVPVVDVGDDVLVVDDNDKTTFRIQVKSSHVTKADDPANTRKVPFARFSLSRTQLRAELQVELLYMLMIRLDASWRFLVVPRKRLFEIHDEYVTTPSAGRGRPPKRHDEASSDDLTLDVVIEAGGFIAWNRLLSEFLDAWPKELRLLETGPGSRMRA
jgi:hypothetical protein